jgi:uncharacterized protein (TIGR03083 family)
VTTSAELAWPTGFVSAIASLADTPSDAFGQPVPWCPGWTTVDVIDHVAAIVLWATALVEAAPDGWIRRSEVPLRPDHADPIEWLQASADAAHRAIDHLSPSLTVRTWKGPGTVAWWQRRLTNEVTVHAWDVATASGRPFVIPPALALDAIDETFELFTPGPDPHPALFDRTVHLHASDVEDDGAGEWLIELDAEGLVVRHEHAKGDAAARGPAAALLLRLWGRLPLDATATLTHLDATGDNGDVEVFGDAALLDALAAAVSR